MPKEPKTVAVISRHPTTINVHQRPLRPMESREVPYDQEIKNLVHSGYLILKEDKGGD